MEHKLFVVTGPSAIGKSYVMNRLVEQFPGKFEVPKLLSTRAPRPGEHPLDREFISEIDYQSRLGQGAFAWANMFYGNKYAYTTEALRPTTKHILVNALPPMIEEFAALPDVVMVGLTVAPSNFELIERRLQVRGDPPEAVKTRLASLSKDVELMTAGAPTINQHGKLFKVTDDRSIEAVIEWIRYNYL